MDARANCRVNRAIQRALDDAATTLDEKSVLAVLHLDATEPFEAATPALEQALYTIFRALSARLSPGSTLYVRTSDRAGHDIELMWEAKEPGADVAEDLPVRHLVRSGPFGDLLELAILGLETICRVRSSHDSSPEQSTSSHIITRTPRVKRRYLFLLPAPERITSDRS